MSIINYLGCNIIFPLSDEDCDNKILIGECFSDDEMKQKVKRHFSTKYIYEAPTNEGVGIWFNKHYKKDYPQSNSESQESFQELGELLYDYLEEGDYCELYTCWVGDEEEKRSMELDQTIELNNFDINKIQIYEKTLLTIRK